MAPTRRPPRTISESLTRLDALLEPDERPAVAGLQRRLDQDRLRVLVAGEAKRGKSTLINALLGAAVLPTGVLPLTSVTTTVTHAEAPGVEVEYADGRVQQVRVDDLPDLVTEVGNPGNERGVARVVVSGPYPVLRSGVELVDTPGVGSVYEHNSTETRTSLRAMDAAIFVTSASPPVSASERALLAELRDHAVHTIVVLSKVDQIDERDRPVVRDFVAGVVAEVLGETVTPAPVSALPALLTGDVAPAQTGMPEFTRALTTYLDTRRHTDLLESIARQAARLAARSADEVRLTLRGADLAAGDLRERQQAFTTRLDEVRRLADEAPALVAAAIGRLIESATAAAAAETRAAAPRTVHALERFTAEHPELGAGELEQAGRSLIADAAATEAVRWRAAAQDWVESDLADLTARLQARLDEQIAAVRAAAAEAFDVQLDAGAVRIGLSESSHFARYGSELEGFSGLLAAGVRARLPGQWGRRRVLLRLRDIAAEATDRGLGRARADIQYRLQEAGRELQAMLGQRYDDAVDRVQRAVDAGRRLSDRAETDRVAAVARLHDRLAGLQAVGEACAGVTAAPVVGT